MNNVADRPDSKIMLPLALPAFDDKQKPSYYFTQGRYIRWAISWIANKIRSLLKTTDKSTSVPLNPLAVYELLQSEKARSRIIKTISHTRRFISDRKIATQLVQEDYKHFIYNGILSKKAQRHVATKLTNNHLLPSLFICNDLIISKHIFEINQNPDYFQSLPEEIKNTSRVYMAAIKIDPYNLAYLRTDVQVNIITKTPRMISYVTPETINKIGTIIKQTDEANQKKLVKDNMPRLLKYASHSVQQSLVTERPNYLAYASLEVQRTVIASDGNLLQYAAETIKKDKRKPTMLRARHKPRSIRKP